MAENAEISTKKKPPGEKTFFKRIFHWGPLIAISIIGTITMNSLYCHLQWWPPERSLAGLLDMIVFLLWNYLCLSNLFQAAYLGPGYVPLKWKPANPSDEEKLQFCKICEGYKVPRSHHCRKCNRCVMKMDHHCPWINNCCGYGNQGNFVQFLIWAVIGCIHATLILGPSIYRAIFRVWYMFYGTGKEPIVELGIYGLFGAIFSFGLAVGVVVSVGFLFGVQMRSILRNKTGIEDYIVSKAMHRERTDKFVYPYDLGWKENFKLVLNWTGRPLNDGIFWPVIDGCDQFTFTVEQIKQKEEKREHAVKYAVVKDYDGSIFCSFKRNGWKAHCCQPMTEESRLKIVVGDHVLVTRWRRHWLYGERTPATTMDHEVTPQTSAGNRGWFPRKCVIELIDDNYDYETDKENVDGSPNKEHDASPSQIHKGSLNEEHAKSE